MRKIYILVCPSMSYNDEYYYHEGGDIINHKSFKRKDEAEKYAAIHNMKMISIEDWYSYRLEDLVPYGKETPPIVQEFIKMVESNDSKLPEFVENNALEIIAGLPSGPWWRVKELELD